MNAPWPIEFVHRIAAMTTITQSDVRHLTALKLIEYASAYLTSEVVGRYAPIVAAHAQDPSLFKDKHDLSPIEYLYSGYLPFLDVSVACSHKRGESEAGVYRMTPQQCLTLVADLAKEHSLHKSVVLDDFIVNGMRSHFCLASNAVKQWLKYAYCVEACPCSMG